MQNCPKYGEDLTRYEAYTTLESRLARLELEAQTYAEVAAGFQQKKARLEEEEKAQVELQVKGAWHLVATFRGKLTQAEAREAAMREALQDVITRMDPDESGLQRAALSPDAGRAPDKRGER